MTDNLQGYGFDIQCAVLRTMSWHSSELHDRYVNNSNVAFDVVPAFDSSAYMFGAADFGDVTTTDEVADERGWCKVFNLFKTEPICGGQISISECSLHHAILDYDVELRNDSVGLLHQHWQDDTVVSQM